MSGSAEQRQREGQIFAAFLDSWPGLAAMVDHLGQPVDDPPDVITTMIDGSTIGWELGEWLNPEQTGEASRRARRDAAITGAIRMGVNRTRHLYICMLTPKSVRFDPRDTQRFAAELEQLIAKVDAQWPENPLWHNPQGHFCVEFPGFPTVAKYLDLAHFHPRVVGEVRREWPDTVPWVVVEPWGGAYDPEDAVGALVALALAKVARFGSLGPGDSRLLLYYERAAYDNTPFEGIAYRSFADVMPVVSEALRQGPRSPFSHVYVLNFHEREAYEVYPDVRPCQA